MKTIIARLKIACKDTMCGRCQYHSEEMGSVVEYDGYCWLFRKPLKENDNDADCCLAKNCFRCNNCLEAQKYNEIIEEENDF